LCAAAFVYVDFKNKISILNSLACRETTLSKIVECLITVRDFNFSIYTETLASSKLTFVPCGLAGPLIW
jgi:hypothetical protein